MLPVEFKQQNLVMGSPKKGDLECLELPVFKGDNYYGQPVFISCWKPNKEELDELMQTGCIWLSIYGQAHPPVWLSTINPFTAPKPITVCKDIVNKTVVCLKHEKHYVLSQLPQGCTGLSVVKNNNEYWSLSDENGKLLGLGYNYYEEVKFVGFAISSPLFHDVISEMEDKGFTLYNTVILERVSYNKPVEAE